MSAVVGSGAAPPGPSVAAFEALDVDPATFDHTAHLYVAWQYLRKHELLEAIGRYRRTLKRLVRHLGIPGKYHETVTWCYLIAVAERMVGDARVDWAVFRERNAELFAPGGAFVKRYFSDDLLATESARRTFRLPDRTAGG